MLPPPRRTHHRRTRAHDRASSVHAQIQASALSDAEVDQVRDARYVPANCVLRLRQVPRRPHPAHPRPLFSTIPPAWPRDRHPRPLEQFTSIIDELSDNLDDYGLRATPTCAAPCSKILSSADRWSTESSPRPRTRPTPSPANSPSNPSSATSPRVRHPAHRRAGRMVQAPPAHQGIQRQERPCRHHALMLGGSQKGTASEPALSEGRQRGPCRTVVDAQTPRPRCGLRTSSAQAASTSSGLARSSIWFRKRSSPVLICFAISSDEAKGRALRSGHGSERRPGSAPHKARNSIHSF